MVGLVNLYHKIPQFLQYVLELLITLLEPMPRFVNDISFLLVDDAGVGRIQYPLRDRLQIGYQVFPELQGLRDRNRFSLMLNLAFKIRLLDCLIQFDPLRLDVFKILFHLG